MITKSTTEPLNAPMPSALSTLPSALWVSASLASRQSPAGIARLMRGMSRSPTIELTTLPTAPPMMTPIARASAFVSFRNAMKPFMLPSPGQKTVCSCRKPLSW